MEHLNILNTREKDEFVEKLEEQYGFEGELDYTVLKSNKDKYYLITRDVANIELDELNINSVGLYFAGEDSGGNLRLSIEGSQMIGPEASENIYELDGEDWQRWIRGEEVEVDMEWSPFLIVTNGEDYMACGKASDGVLKNYVPKSRTISSDIS